MNSKDNNSIYNQTSLMDYMTKEQTITDFTCNGTCSECGNCCSNSLPMTDKEVNIIQNYVERNKIRPHVLNMPLATPVLDLTCPFLSYDRKTHRCNIYPVRPYICRYYLCCNKEQNPVELLSNEHFADPTFCTRNVRQTFF